MRWRLGVPRRRTRGSQSPAVVPWASKHAQQCTWSHALFSMKVGSQTGGGCCFSGSRMAPRGVGTACPRLSGCPFTCHPHPFFSPCVTAFATSCRLQMEEQSLIKVKGEQELMIQKLSDSSSGAAYV